ncbi:unnamed protein product [Rhodiola kirilowii]
MVSLDDVDMHEKWKCCIKIMQNLNWFRDYRRHDCFFLRVRLVDSGGVVCRT